MAPKMRSVLWVDDEAELLEPHRIFLRANGYDVQAASNADDAIAMLRRQPFDIVLLDEQMPGKRGLEAYREMREVAPATAVLMVTKSEDDAILREALGASVRDYLVKPRGRSSSGSAISKRSAPRTSNGAAGSTGSAS